MALDCKSGEKVCQTHIYEEVLSFILVLNFFDFDKNANLHKIETMLQWSPVFTARFNNYQGFAILASISSVSAKLF